MKTVLKITVIVAIAGCMASSVLAQTSSSVSKPRAHHGLLGLLHHNKRPIFAGKIIGNKNSHIYHLPGDPGALPAEKNRIYFHTEAQAIAAGYRHSAFGGGHHAHRAKKMKGM